MSALDLLSAAAFLREDEASSNNNTTSSNHDTNNVPPSSSTSGTLDERREPVQDDSMNPNLDPALFQSSRPSTPQPLPSAPAPAPSIAALPPPPSLPPLNTSPNSSSRNWQSAILTGTSLPPLPPISTASPPPAALPSIPASNLGKRQRARTSAASEDSISLQQQQPQRKRTTSTAYPRMGASANQHATPPGMHLFTDSTGAASLTSLLGSSSANAPGFPEVPALPSLLPHASLPPLPNSRALEPPPNLPPLLGSATASTSARRRVPRLPHWTVPEDSGIIRCVCPYTADDGFTIQCDLCNVWQHAACVCIAMDDVPEEYRCEMCDPEGAAERRVDRVKAEAGMKRRLELLETSSHIVSSSPVKSSDVPGSKVGRVGLTSLLNAPSGVDEIVGGFGGLPPLPPIVGVNEGKPSAGTGQRGKPRRSAGSTPGSAPALALPIPANESNITFSTPGYFDGLTSQQELPRPTARQTSTTITANSTAASTPSVPVTPSGVPRDAIGRKRRQAKHAGPGRPRASAGSTPNASAPPTPGVLGGPSTGILGSAFSFDASIGSVVTPRPTREAAAVANANITGNTLNGAPKTPAAASDDEDYLSTAAGGTDDRYETWRFEFTPIEKDLIRDKNLVERLEQIVAQDGIIPEDGMEIEMNDPTNPLAPQLTLLRQRQEASRPRSGPYAKDTLIPLLYDPTPFVVLDELPEALPVAVKPLPPSSFHLIPPAAASYTPHSSQAPTYPYPRPTMHGLFAVNAISSGSYIAPLHGQITSLESYRSDPINQYESLGVPKPGVRFLPYPWSLAIDSRMFGNEIRFARSGCHPNAVVQAIKLVPSSTTATELAGLDSGSAAARDTTKTDDASITAGRQSRASTPWADQRRSPDLSTQLIFGIFATSDIGRREEIVLPWDWDDFHIVHTLPALMSAPPLPPGLTERALEPLSRKMAQVTNTILGTTHCACDKKRDCALHWMCRGAAASLPLSKSALLKPREPFAVILLNALGAGNLLQQQATGGGIEAMKPGRKMKKPDVGPLLGLERGWVVRPLKESEASPERELKPSSSPISDFPPPPNQPWRMFEDEPRRDSENGEHDQKGRFEMDPSSELSELEDDDEEEEIEDEDEDRSSIATIRQQSMDIDRSPASSRTPTARRSIIDGNLTDDSDLTEPLSNLSDEEDDAPSRKQAKPRKKIISEAEEDDSDEEEKAIIRKAKAHKQELSQKKRRADVDEGYPKQLGLKEGKGSKMFKRPKAVKGLSKGRKSRTSSPDPPQRKPSKLLGRKLGKNREDEKGRSQKAPRAASPPPPQRVKPPKVRAVSRGISPGQDLFGSDEAVYSARHVPLPPTAAQTQDELLTSRAPPPPPPAWSMPAEEPMPMQVEPPREPTPPKEPTPPPKEPSPPPPPPRARLSLAAYRQRLAQKPPDEVGSLSATEPLTTPVFENEQHVDTPASEVPPTLLAQEEGELKDVVMVTAPSMPQFDMSAPGIPAALAEAFNALQRSSVPAPSSASAAVEAAAPASTQASEAIQSRLPPPPPPPPPAPASPTIPEPEKNSSVMAQSTLAHSSSVPAAPISAQARSSFTSAEDILKSIGDYFSKPASAPSTASAASTSASLSAPVAPVAAAGYVSPRHTPSPPPPPAMPAAMRSPSIPTQSLAVSSRPPLSPVLPSTAAPLSPSFSSSALGLDTSSSEPTRRTSDTHAKPASPTLSATTSSTSRFIPSAPRGRGGRRPSAGPPSPSFTPSASSRPSPPVRPFDLDSVPTGPRAMTSAGASRGGGWNGSPNSGTTGLPGVGRGGVSNWAGADRGERGGYRGSRGAGYSRGGIPSGPSGRGINRGSTPLGPSGMTRGAGTWAGRGRGAPRGR